MIFGEKSSRNRSGERLRTTPAKKNDKNRVRRRLRTHVFVPGAVFSGFWAPGRDSKIAKKPTLAPMTRLLFAPAIVFLAFCSLGCVLEASRTDSGGSADPPGRDFARFFCRFRRDLVVVCRVPPECCRDTPPASRTHSAGFLWGTAISRSELNNYPSATRIGKQ